MRDKERESLWEDSLNGESCLQLRPMEKVEEKRRRRSTRALYRCGVYVGDLEAPFISSHPGSSQITIIISPPFQIFGGQKRILSTFAAPGWDYHSETFQFPPKVPKCHSGGQKETFDPRPIGLHYHQRAFLLLLRPFQSFPGSKS